MMMAELEQSRSQATAQNSALVLEFAGRQERILPGTTFVIGRGADLPIEDNKYVHRRFLEIVQHEGIWRLTNVGSRLTASVASADGMAQSWLDPGASMPLVFDSTAVMFTAGETTYELTIHAETPFYQVSTPWTSTQEDDGVAGLLSPVQRILLTALAEPLLRLNAPGAVQLPAMDDVARRLGWAPEKFQRRVGSLIDKFSRHGVRGLERSAAGALPDSARTRIAEYAVGARIVTADDLDLLEAFSREAFVGAAS